MKKLAAINTFLLLISALASFSVLANITTGEHSDIQAPLMNHEIIVKFKKNVLIDSTDTLNVGVCSINTLNELFKAEKINRLLTANSAALSNIYRVEFASEVDIPTVVDMYNSDPNVEYAQPNYIRRSSAAPNDVSYPLQWAHQRMQSEFAWHIQTGRNTTVIAIIDTGVDWNHTDLAYNIWVNPAEILNGVDDDGNGYVDDIRGWDFVDTTDPVWPGEDGTTRDNNPMDFDGHGTHCAGIAAAATNNTIGIAGMSWASKIMAVRAGFVDSTGLGLLEDDDIAPAIVYAADNGAQIISMSFGGNETSSVLEDAIDYAHSAGVLLVAAAGNEDTDVIQYPAGYSNVLAVAATNNDDGKATFSSYGSWVDVAAPGVSIYSTTPDDDYLYMSGTSMATPYIAGLAALILSENETLTNVFLRNVICNATDPTNSSEYIGTGRINAYKALLLVSNATGADIAIVGISFSKTAIGYGHMVPINVDVENQGITEAVFNITVYANTSVAIIFQNITLPAGENSTIICSWNTAGFVMGDYSLGAAAHIADGEDDIGDNYLTDGWILVTIPGDIDGSREVDIFDVIRFTKAYGSETSHTDWDPNADIDGNNVIDVYDAIILASHFGESW